MEWEFESHYCLKSITLPKVTTIGESALYSCFYVETLTFGSVITSVGNNAFSYLGDPGSVTGGKHDLVLNCGQMEGNYIPDIEKKRMVLLSSPRSQLYMEKHHLDPHWRVRRV